MKRRDYGRLVERRASRSASSTARRLQPQPGESQDRWKEQKFYQMPQQPYAPHQSYAPPYQQQQRQQPQVFYEKTEKGSSLCSMRLRQLNNSTPTLGNHHSSSSSRTTRTATFSQMQGERTVALGRQRTDTVQLRGTTTSTTILAAAQHCVERAASAE